MSTTREAAVSPETAASVNRNLELVQGYIRANLLRTEPFVLHEPAKLR